MVKRWPHRKWVFSHRVKEFVVGVDGEERGVDDFCGELRFANLAGRCVEPANVNSLTVAISHAMSCALGYKLESRITSEIHEVVAALRGRAPATADRYEENESKIKVTTVEPHDIPFPPGR